MKSCHHYNLEKNINIFFQVKNETKVSNLKLSGSANFNGILVKFKPPNQVA